MFSSLRHLTKSKKIKRMSESNSIPSHEQINERVFASTKTVAMTSNLLTIASSLEANAPVAMPGAPSSILAPSSKALCY